MISVHLVKEARAQLGVLLGAALIVPALTLAVALVWQRTGSIDASAVSWILGGAFALAVAILVPTLVAREPRGAGTLFLERVPGGMRAGFVAKWCALLALLVSAALITVLGIGLASLAVPALRQELAFDVDAAAAMTAGGALGFWLLMAACWLPRSALAVPGGLIAAAMLALPFSLTEHARVLEFEGKDIAWIGVSVALAASLAAWPAFTRGLRLGRRGGVALLWSLPALGLLTTSLGAWNAQRNYELHHFDPTASNAFLGECRLDVDGRRAFVGYTRDRQLNYSAVIDLSTGAWEQIGGLLTIVIDPSFMERGFALDDTAVPSEILGFWDAYQGPVTWFDAASRLELLREDHGLGSFQKNPRSPLYWLGNPLEERVRAQRSRRSSLRWPDGRRAWIFGGAIEIERPGAAPERVALPGQQPFVTCWTDEYALDLYDATDPLRCGVFDLHRATLYPMQTMQGVEGRNFACLASGWLGSWTKHGARRWKLVDPETGRAEPAAVMHADDAIVRNLGGNRLLVQRSDAFEIVDFASGRRELVEADGVPAGAKAHRQRHRTPSGRPLFTVKSEAEAALVRFDVEDRRLISSASFPVSGHEEVQCVGSLDEDTAYVLVANRRIARVRFGSPDAEILFPR